MGTAKAKTTSNDMLVRLFRSPSAKVGTHDVRPTKNRVVCTDLSNVRQAAGIDIYGILGVDFFSDRIVRFSPHSGEVAIATRDRKKSDSDVVVPLIVDPSGLLFIDSGQQIVGGDFRLLIDTAATNEISLSDERFDKWVESDAIALESVSSATNIVGFRRVTSGRLRRFQFGPFRHADLIVDKGSIDRIGLAYLQRFDAVFDVTEKVLILSEGIRCYEHRNRDLSGLELLAVNSQVVVQVVHSGEPAARAGLLEGDVIISIDQQPVSGKDLVKVREEFRSRPGRVIKLILKRTTEVHTATIRLQESS
jgi:hypothetical protein